MKSPKRTISASGGPGSLQMVSKSDIGRCASLLAVPRRGVDTKRCASKDAGPKGGRFKGGPTSIGERKECQQERWAPKGSGVHIDWRKERVPARTLAPKGGGL